MTAHWIGEEIEVIQQRVPWMHVKKKSVYVDLTLLIRCLFNKFGGKHHVGMVKRKNPN